MTLVGIPLVFVLYSTVEIARGMWMYETLAHAVKEGVRYTIVHGKSCTIPPNTCSVTIGQIAARIRSSGVGLPPETLQVTFTPATGTPVQCLLRDCLTDTTTFPPTSSNSPGSEVTISAEYPFRSPIAMFWPGAGMVGPVGLVNLPASSTDTIQF